MKQRRVVILGGGAAGMMAAIVAARAGAGVLVLERMQRIGKKLLATGNGRCNYANTHPEISRFHGADPRFAQGALGQFGVEATLAFFEELGIAPRVEEEGKIFPVSGQASAVLDVLRYEMERLGVEVICEANADRVAPAGKGFRCRCTDGREVQGGRVIIAAGGKSSPNLGSNGGGFRVAEALGHRVRPLFPALVQVRLDQPFLKQLRGVKLDAEAAVLLDGKPRRAERGEVLFTDYGLSGLPILQISRIVSEFADSGRDLAIRLDLFPDSTLEELSALLARRFAAAPYKPTEFSLVGLLHKRLIPILLKEAGIVDLQRECGTLTPAEVQRLAAVLHAWRLPCAGTQSWMHSQVTAGGVEVRDVHADTLESRRVPGLYFAGEVLDIDGDSGGFNLQWAWSSGYVAGKNAAG